jgi:hypothetical protein
MALKQMKLLSSSGLPETLLLGTFTLRVESHTKCGASQRVEIQPLKQTRRIHLRHLRQDPKTGGWRSLRVRDLRVPSEGMAVDVWGDLEVVEIQSKGRQIQMEVGLEQCQEGQLRKVELGLLKAPHERLLRLSPRDWSRLDNEGIRPETLRRP